MDVGNVNQRRIFSFQDKAPAAPESHQNPLRVIYSIKTPMSSRSSTRYIPSSPERILDAPDIINDYCERLNSISFVIPYLVIEDSQSHIQVYFQIWI